MVLLITTFLALQLIQSARSAPSISFPINSQLPPVARIDELFSYSFSPYTFRSDSNITYSLGDHPSWLSIESEERRLFGTPEEGNVDPGDVVGQPVQIIATDSTGSASLDVTLVVSRNDAPEVKIPISDQVENFGPYSAPSSLLSYPSKAFEYSFDPDTFGSQTDGLNYYAVSDDNSPLPAWMSFNTDSLTFSGTTPPFETLVQPPQTFNFELVASDVVGFSASSISFSIVVGSHKLTTDKPTINFNTTRGSLLSYEGLEDGIIMDGKPVKPGDLDVSTIDLPKWLSFNTDTWEIEGTPGDNDRSTNFTINFHDDFADTLSVLGVITVATSLFESTFPNMEVMPGDKFELDLAPYFRDPDDIQVTIDAGEDDWLKLNGLNISGRVPESASGNSKISVEAMSKSTGLKEIEALAISFVDPKAETTTVTPTSTATATSSPTETGSGSDEEDEEDKEHGRLSATDILLATVIPITFIALLLMLLICFFRHRRTKRNYLSSRYRDKISKPIIGSLRVNGSDPSIRHVENEKGAPRIETQILRLDNSGYAEMHSRTSSGSRSDLESLDLLSTPDLPPGFMGGALGTRGSLSNATRSSEARQSWFTVEGGTATHHSDGSTSHRSGTTLSESTHQLLASPNMAGFRNGLDLTIPSLDFASMQPTPDAAYRPTREAKTHRSLDVYSTTTSSSEALPSSKRHDIVRKEVPSPLREQDESASSVPELRPPTRARLSSQQWVSGRRPGTSTGPKTGSQVWHSSEDSQGGQSIQTETSFGSAENWRVIGGPGKSYHNLVEESPFHPGPAGGRSGGSSAEHGAGTQSDSGGWKTEGSSGQLSKGSEGSFKAFL